MNTILFFNGATTTYTQGKYINQDRHRAAYRKEEANVCLSCDKDGCRRCNFKKRANVR